ncbi:MAG: DUF502 domain-containing protein [Candidatus Dependentiae bacterium]|nr:DUF502 domain-containing protein [Candidatus Dependentiae bacterium]
MSISKITSRIGQHLSSLFLNGLLTILPIILTIALFNTSFKLITGWLQPLRRLTQCTCLNTIPYAEVILAIVAIFAIGAFIKIVILRPLVHAFEHILFRIPLVRPVYSGIKQLVAAFSFQNKVTFKQVVMVEFPRKNMYSIGFLTGELSENISPNKDEKFFNIFIPTTPNPTTGFLVILPETSIHPIDDITRQEAMTMVISGGIVQPERFMKNKL